MITKDYKLTIYRDFNNFGDLFDRINDPDELTNLWYNKEFKDKRDYLVNQLLHEILNAQTKLPRRIAAT